MIEVLSDSLWERLSEQAKNSKSKKAAIAYVSDDRIVSFKNDDILVVDASDEAIATGKTSAKILAKAFNLGASIHSCDTLHAKTIVFDHHAYIGSANMSSNSKDNLTEVGLISDHPSILSGAVQLVEKLKSMSKLVDEDFIERILNIKVERQGNKNKKPKIVKLKKPRFWMISLRNDVDYPGDENVVEKDNQKIDVSHGEEAAWFWLKKGTIFFEQVKMGDSIVVIERNDTHALEPDCAFRHFTIKDITDDNGAGTKAYHYARSNKYRIEWENFKHIASNAGISRLGSGLSTARELSEKQSNLLFELWGD
ncbi:phospholipase D-like domain-containing protein [Vibrio splendidus]